jgi:hypothetical protein
MYAKIHKNFVEESDRFFLLDDIKERASRFIQNKSGANRQLLRLDGTDMYQDIHKKYFDKIVNHLGIKNAEIDPLLGILYSVIHPTGFIHNHIDNQWMYESGNFVNYRFNLLLQRGDGDGYDPIIQNTKHHIDSGDAWSFPASLYLHGTEPVSGPENRIVIQYGFILHKNEYEKLFNSGELILSKRMKDYYAKNSRNGVTRSRKDFFSQPAEIVS